MIDVFVTGTDADIDELAAIGNHATRRCHFSTRAAEGAAHLRIDPEWTGRLFAAGRGQGVTVSSAQSEGIAQYLGIPRARYLLLCGLLGLVQWRALELNPLLVPEDLIHRNPPQCVFAYPIPLEACVLALEDVHICPACASFFRCLGVEPGLIEAARQLGRGSIAVSS